LLIVSANRHRSKDFWRFFLLLFAVSQIYI
jgi:hypothetical protein